MKGIQIDQALLCKTVKIHFPEQHLLDQFRTILKQSTCVEGNSVFGLHEGSFPNQMGNILVTVNFWVSFDNILSEDSCAQACLLLRTASQVSLMAHWPITWFVISLFINAPCPCLCHWFFFVSNICEWFKTVINCTLNILNLRNIFWNVSFQNNYCLQLVIKFSKAS